MIAEVGHFALVLALLSAIAQATFGLLGAARADRRWMSVGPAAAVAQLGCLAVAYAALTASFLLADYTLAYVAENSNRQLPLLYRISAVWGAHEGSMLLWVLILAVWTGAVAGFSGRLPLRFRARVIGVLGLLSTGFLLFTVATSNPFARLAVAPLDGNDLNPLLQDPGMAIHPPILYLGYVGLAVPFAFACAALADSKLDAAWTRWTRPWTTVAWVFLTIGITLGSWWAYNELGWGGWWFWDPVENASFMPWLIATALLHSLAVSEQRGAFKAWTVLLAIAGFSFSLLGAFLVRSGVLVSVHAFATDPTRGVFLLGFLAAAVGAALALFATRAHRVSGGGYFDYLSRETALLVNNVLLVVVAAAIALGTLYPLVHDALGLGKLSVGPPYFNLVFIPLMLTLGVALGVGPHLRWKRDGPGRLLRSLAPAALASAMVGIVAVLLTGSVALVAALAVAAWVALATGQGVIARLRNRRDGWRALTGLPRGFVGMSIAHLGMAAFAVGVAATGTLSQEADVRLAPGDVHHLGGYRFEFHGVTEVAGPNYRAERGRFSVYRDDRRVAVLEPEKRHYPSQGAAMTEAAVDPGLTRDLYVALGEPLDSGAWAVRIHYKPFIRWIWGGAMLMALGGLVAASDRRYRQPRPTREPIRESAPESAQSDNRESLGERPSGRLAPAPEALR